MKKKLRVALLIAIGTGGIAPPVYAESIGLRSYGLRGGIAANPDQFYGGLHLDLGRLTERVRLQPSFEVGFGNGVILGAANFDAQYLFSGKSFRPYAGGGLGLNVFEVTNGQGESGGLDIGPALNLVGGVEWGTRRGLRAVGRYLLEARLGFGDTTELKIAFGVSF
jgi:hypothetical protein